jgi:hypothetical protein
MHATPLATILIAAATAATGIAVAGPAAATTSATASNKDCKGSTTASSDAKVELVTSSVAGYRNHRQAYSWQVKGDGGGAGVTILLRGFDSDGKETYYDAGTWFSRQSGKAVVPWGNVLARPGLIAVSSLPIPVKFTGC